MLKEFKWKFLEIKEREFQHHQPEAAAELSVDSMFRLFFLSISIDISFIIPFASYFSNPLSHLIKFLDISRVNFSVVDNEIKWEICDTLPAREGEGGGGGGRSEWGEIESMKWSVQKFTDLFPSTSLCVYTLMIGRILWSLRRTAQIYVIQSRRRLFAI